LPWPLALASLRGLPSTSKDASESGSERFEGFSSQLIFGSMQQTLHKANRNHRQILL